MHDAKQELRTRLRAYRRELATAQQQQAARAIADHITALPLWRSAASIALYLASDGEIDPGSIARAARALGKVVYLPALDGKTLAFAQWQEDVTLVPNRYGIGEPPAAVGRCEASELDIICLPLVACDRHGGRLGMGAGYYDRALAETARERLVGLAHAGQLVTAVPTDEWDVRLGWVLTEEALLDCQAGS